MKRFHLLTKKKPAKKVEEQDLDDLEGIEMEKKKLSTAFEMFKNDVFEETTKENPECNNSELLRIIAQKWILSTDSIKEKYEKMFQQVNLLEKR